MRTTELYLRVVAATQGMPLHKAADEIMARWRSCCWRWQAPTSNWQPPRTIGE